MLHVYTSGKHVAMINRQHKGADGFIKETPWLLLRNSGRIDRFATMSEAREEAKKSWSRAEVRKS
jgi:hypothetical protein